MVCPIKTPPVRPRSPAASGRVFRHRRLSPEKLLALLEEKKVASVTETIAVLPEDLRCELHAVPPVAKPPVRIVRKSARDSLRARREFIVAFNGDPAQRRFDSLEMIAFRDQTKAFGAADAGVRRRKAPVIRKNPKACLGCHGKEPHPIWNSYRNWPGSYGAADDASPRAITSRLSGGGARPRAIPAFDPGFPVRDVSVSRAGTERAPISTE